MANNWMNFLSEIGASFNEQQEVNFNSANESALNLQQGDFFLTDLSWLGIIQVSGDDKHTYLQGQLTNDVNAVSSSLSQLNGLCTPKGRMRALFSIFARKENLYLQLPLPLLADNLKRLKMFVLMSKVELSDASDTLAKIGICGNKAVKILQNSGFTIPTEVNMVTEHEEFQLIRLSGQMPRFECIGSAENMQSLWQSLQPLAQLINTEHWRLLDINAGIPNVFPQTSEMYIPQMLNLQAMNGISFKKGCYTGQEVVARMQYLGKLKRRMYRAHCDTDQLPLPGAALHSTSSTSGQGSGNIVDAQKSSDGGIDLLAVITTDAADKQDIFLDEDMKLPLNICDLPYTIETS